MLPPVPPVFQDHDSEMGSINGDAKDSRNSLSRKNEEPLDANTSGEHISNRTAPTKSKRECSCTYYTSLHLLTLRRRPPTPEVDS